MGCFMEIWLSASGMIRQMHVHGLNKYLAMSVVLWIFTGQNVRMLKLTDRQMRDMGEQMVEDVMKLNYRQNK